MDRLTGLRALSAASAVGLRRQRARGGCRLARSDPGTGANGDSRRRSRRVRIPASALRRRTGIVRNRRNRARGRRLNRGRVLNRSWVLNRGCVLNRGRVLLRWPLLRHAGFRRAVPLRWSCFPAPAIFIPAVAVRSPVRGRCYEAALHLDWAAVPRTDVTVVAIDRRVAISHNREALASLQNKRDRREREQQGNTSGAGLHGCSFGLPDSCNCTRPMTAPVGSAITARQ